MREETIFSGSYLPEDVHFLLQPVQMEMTPVELKEEYIQSGKKHYSEMLSQEPEPTPWHIDLFRRSLDQGAERLATEVQQLANALVAQVIPPSYWQAWCARACRWA